MILPRLLVNENVISNEQKHSFDASRFVLSEDFDKTWKSEKVNHPDHYGGKDNPYEAIKVIEAWELGFNLGNTVKYIARAGKKDSIIQDLEKARFYLDREIEKLKSQ